MDKPVTFSSPIEARLMPAEFDAIASGEMKALFRRDDNRMHYAAHQTVEVRELTCAGAQFAARRITVEITHVLRDQPYLTSGHALLSVEVTEEPGEGSDEAWRDRNEELLSDIQRDEGEL